VKKKNIKEQPHGRFSTGRVDRNGTILVLLFGALVASDWTVFWKQGVSTC